MPLALDSLPIATAYDSVEDPPGSVDPLGTLTVAERLADVLLPGFTARMWRARLLTVAVMGARVADCVVNLMGNREDVRLEARLAFERLLASAVVRVPTNGTAEYKKLTRGLPGAKLAKRALAADDEPLTRGNFLKGQAVNGPYGVVARLARQLELVDEDGNLGREAPNLILAWCEDQELRGIFDEDGSDRAGSVWIRDVAKAVVACISKQEWPGPGSRIWDRLVSKLRVDQIGPQERRALVRLLDSGEIRPRVIRLLRGSALSQIYRDRYRSHGRGGSEKSVLLAMRQELAMDHLDRTIDTCISAIDAYESIAGVLQQVFDTLLWGLKQWGGQAAPAVLLTEPVVARHIQRMHTKLGRAKRSLERGLEALRNKPALASQDLLEPIERMGEEARIGGASPQSMVEEVMRRHERVQKEKRKCVWIDRDRTWMLMPGFGVEEERPPEYGGSYLHPFRVSNAYSFLADLGRVSLAISDGEEE